MAAALGRIVAVAGASLRDVLRRPGALVALTIAATVVAFTPAVSSRALDAADALAPRLTVSTIHLYAVLLAAWAGPTMTAPGTPLGHTAEVAVTALRPLEYLLGRAAGLLTAIALHAVALVTVGILATAAAGLAPGAMLSFAPATAVLQAAPILALGALLGAVWSGTLAMILILLVIVATRLAPPGLTESPLYAALLPDVERLAPGPSGPPAGGVLGIAATAAATQALGYLLLASVALSRESRATHETDG